MITSNKTALICITASPCWTWCISSFFVRNQAQLQLLYCKDQQRLAQTYILGT